MCANFKPLLPEQAPQLDLFEPTFKYPQEVYPGYLCPILIKNKNHMQWREALFGLVPKWSTDNKIARHTYNARSETVQQKPSFRHAWSHNQFALIPAQTIFETRYQKDKAERWAIQRNDGQPFTIAAIYELTQIDGQLVRSVSMLTINADHHPLMQQFHAPDDEKRSVVVIPEQHRKDWLNADHQTAKQMLKELREADYEIYFAPRLKAEN